MVVIGAWIGLVCAAFFIHKLIERVDALEKRIAWLEDRSPQAEYLRSLENAEKGW